MSADAVDLPERMVARFGRAGLRQIVVPEESLPPRDVVLLTEVGVPRQVGPYFVSYDAPVRLDEYCRSIGVLVPEGASSSSYRIGWDRGAQLCVDQSGVVRAEFVDADEPGLVVNVSLPAFLESLLALDEGLSSIASTENLSERAELVRALIRRIAVADLTPTESPDSWWLQVLQDIRHTMMHSAYTSFEIIDSAGKEQIISTSGALCLHPEERMRDHLEATGVRPDQVKRIYTELEACFLPGHYCSMWLAEIFPHAEVTHAIDYGDSAAEREEGLVTLMRRTQGQPGNPK